MGSVRLPKWQRVALRLGAEISRDQLDPLAVSSASSASAGKWIVAVSGGADSVALLLLIWAHWPDRRDDLVVAHFDHGLRGKESRADARFCGRVAKSLGVIFASEIWANPPAKPSEAAARKVRREFLLGEAEREGAKLIWTGHHQDDIAESMLMRLARGSGTTGLAAPRPVQAGGAGQPDSVRPLLSLSREQLRKSLHAAGGVWREDQSNQEREYFRNRVRHDVVPNWVKASQRDANAGASWSRSLLQDDDDALESWLDQLDVIDESDRLLLKRLKGKPRAIWRRALHRWLLLQPYEGDLSRRGFEDLLDLIQRSRGSRFSLGVSAFAVKRRGILFFEQLSALERVNK